MAPDLYSPRVVPSKEGGDWVTDLVGGGFGKHRPDDVRRKATLKRGPMASAIDRDEREADARARCWARPATQ
jgi:hypothetical protein